MLGRADQQRVLKRTLKGPPSLRRRATAYRGFTIPLALRKPRSSRSANLHEMLTPLFASPAALPLAGAIMRYCYGPEQPFVVAFPEPISTDPLYGGITTVRRSV